MIPDSIIQWDQNATLWLNQLGTGSWDPFWTFMTATKVWFPAYILFVVFAFWRLGWKKGIAVTLTLIATVVFTDQFSVYVKDSVQRLRPCYNAWMQTNGLRLPEGMNGNWFGFFSGHASNTFGFAAASYFGLKLYDNRHKYLAYGIGVFIWAAIVSFSRIIMGAHFLGDILVGSVFGFAAGWSVVYLMHLLFEKIVRS